MSATTSDVYGSYPSSFPDFITKYGNTITAYGNLGYSGNAPGSVVSALLMETGSYILQESNGKILLG
jgi:hypothetical protein